MATVTIIIHGDNSERAAADDSESTTEDAPMSRYDDDDDDEGEGEDVMRVAEGNSSVETAATAVVRR